MRVHCDSKLEQPAAARNIVACLESPEPCVLYIGCCPPRQTKKAGTRLKFLTAISAVFFGSLLCSADTIRLKNGTSLNVDRVTQKNGIVEYFIGSTRYTVPLADVVGIDASPSFGITVKSAPAGMVTPARVPEAGARSDYRAAPSGKLKAGPPPPLSWRGIDGPALLKQIVNLGRVDDVALDKIEAEGIAIKSAVAYSLAGDFEYRQNQLEAARRYMKRAVSFAPDEPGLLTWYESLLLLADDYPEAVAVGEHAVQLAPKSAPALAFLGLAYYDSGRTSDAISTWNRAQQIQPTEAVAEYLAKAGRETAVEADFDESQSSHFALRYEGHHTGITFRADLLRALERQYAELSRDLNFAPRETIIVILYTEQQFFAVTQAPSWADGLNDGKLRIATKQLSGVTDELEALLKHELTHSFVHALAGWRCPAWLNEGLAQMEEPRSTTVFASRLAALFRAGKAAPLSALEESFGSLNAQQALIAYAESLATVEYLREHYGMAALRRILQLIADGEEPESALQQAVQLSYRRLESDTAEHLAKQ